MKGQKVCLNSFIVFYFNFLKFVKLEAIDKERQTYKREK